jgi:hypothetical protein
MFRLALAPDMSGQPDTWRMAIGFPDSGTSVASAADMQFTMIAASIVTATGASIATGTSTVDMNVFAGNPLCPITWLFAAPPNPEGPFFLLNLRCRIGQNSG